MARPKNGESPWKVTREAAAELGISDRQLRKLKESGLLKIGTHYRISTRRGAAKQRYLWHVERCGDAMAIEPEYR